MLVIGCFSPRETMSEKDINIACREAWKEIRDRDYRAWDGMPASCRYADFDAAFPRLRDAHGQGRLGRDRRQALFRMHVDDRYQHPLKTWFRDDRLVLIEVAYPELPYSTPELLSHLGDPEAQLDYHLDVMPVSEGAWIYPSRGLALFLDAGRREVMRIALFHACSLDGYVKELHPDVRVREYPLRGE